MEERGNMDVPLLVTGSRELEEMSIHPSSASAFSSASSRSIRSSSIRQPSPSSQQPYDNFSAPLFVRFLSSSSPSASSAAANEAIPQRELLASAVYNRHSSVMNMNISDGNIDPEAPRTSRFGFNAELGEEFMDKDTGEVVTRLIKLLKAVGLAPLASPRSSNDDILIGLDEQISEILQSRSNTQKTVIKTSHKKTKWFSSLRILPGLHLQGISYKVYQMLLCGIVLCTLPIQVYGTVMYLRAANASLHGFLAWATGVLFSFAMCVAQLGGAGVVSSIKFLPFLLRVGAGATGAFSAYSNKNLRMHAEAGKRARKFSRLDELGTEQQLRFLSYQQRQQAKEYISSSTPPVHSSSSSIIDDRSFASSRSNFSAQDSARSSAMMSSVRSHQSMTGAPPTPTPSSASNVDSKQRELNMAALGPVATSVLVRPAVRLDKKRLKIIGIVYSILAVLAIIGETLGLMTPDALDVYLLFGLSTTAALFILGLAGAFVLCACWLFICQSLSARIAHIADSIGSTWSDGTLEFRVRQFQRVSKDSRTAFRCMRLWLALFITAFGANLGVDIAAFFSIQGKLSVLGSNLGTVYWLWQLLYVVVSSSLFLSPMYSLYILSRSFNKFVRSLSMLRCQTDGGRMELECFAHMIVRSETDFALFGVRVSKFSLALSVATATVSILSKVFLLQSQ